MSLTSSGPSVMTFAVLFVRRSSSDFGDEFFYRGLCGRPGDFVPGGHLGLSERRVRRVLPAEDPCTDILGDRLNDGYGHQLRGHGTLLSFGTERYASPEDKPTC